MATLFGRPMDRETIERSVGRMDQVAGARAFAYEDGPARGMRGIDVWTGEGLEFTVLPDRCLDLLGARMNGRSLAWQSGTGPVSPERYDAGGLNWLRSFSGGLLVTCGLRHFGDPDTDPDGQSWGLHGRASHLSAEDVAVERGWVGGEYRIQIRGRVVEAEVHQPTVVLERTITTALGSRVIEVADRVTNVGYEPSPFMLLYHCNLGWPLLSEQSRLWVHAAKAGPAVGRTVQDPKRYGTMAPPTPRCPVDVYQLDVKAGRDGRCRAALANPKLDGGMALEIAWSKAALGYMTEWRMMGEGLYVLGVEPGNCPLAPREMLRERGLMPMLRPGESRETGVTFRVCLGAKELADLKKRVGA